MGRAQGRANTAGATRRGVAPAPDRLQAALADFEASRPKLSIWQRYPHISEEEDAYTDRWACESVSRELVAELRDRGVPAQLVHAQDAEHPDHDEHYWVRVGDTDIDYTARQFYNLEWPHAPEHQDLPCPMTWPANDAHPVAGGYASVTVDPTGR